MVLLIRMTFLRGPGIRYLIMTLKKLLLMKR